MRKNAERELLALGFEIREGAYVRRSELADTGMSLYIEVSEEGEVLSKVTDIFSGEEYTLHLSASAVGTFVGKVRMEYERELASVRAVLLQGYRFGSLQSQQIVDYVSKKYGDELEFLWDDSPDSAISRRKDTGKWYLIIMSVKASRIGLVGEEKIEVMNLHAEPDVVEKIVDGVHFFPAYHMNKKHWLTVPLDKRVSSEKIFEMIDDSYRLAKK